MPTQVTIESVLSTLSEAARQEVVDSLTLIQEVRRLGVRPSEYRLPPGSGRAPQLQREPSEDTEVPTQTDQ